MDIKSQVAPKGLQYRSADFVISDKYATILTVVSYPKFITPGFLSGLTNMSGIKVVIKHSTSKVKVPKKTEVPEEEFVPNFVNPFKKPDYAPSDEKVDSSSDTSE